MEQNRPDEAINYYEEAAKKVKSIIVTLSPCITLAMPTTKKRILKKV
ncbi:MAG: hypothetical protein IPF70_16230 [Saprospiraceae bacterium]|nr:hypothetical protein [Saprospiraceae bacterium]